MIRSASPDGSRYAVGQGSSIVLYNMHSNEVEEVLSGEDGQVHIGEISALCWGVAGLLSGDTAGVVVLWYPQRQRHQYAHSGLGSFTPTMLKHGKMGVTCLRWSTASKKLVVGIGCSSGEAYVCFWEQDCDRWFCKTIAKNRSSILAIDFHPSKPQLALVSANKRLSVRSCWMKGYFPETERKSFGALIYHTTLEGIGLLVRFHGEKSLLCATNTASVNLVNLEERSRFCMKLSTLSLKSLTIQQETLIGETYDAQSIRCRIWVISTEQGVTAATQILQELKSDSHSLISWLNRDLLTYLLLFVSQLTNWSHLQLL
jgi:WD40 repeat protein